MPKKAVLKKVCISDPAENWGDTHVAVYISKGTVVDYLGSTMCGGSLIGEVFVDIGVNVQQRIHAVCNGPNATLVGVTAVF